MARSGEKIAVIGARLPRTRWLVRAPILIYTVGAGPVLGDRFVMLEHIGRTSGSVRRVVLEVFNHPAPDTYVVASGHGEQSQWLRNINANPRVRLFVAGRSPANACARRLTQAEADCQLAAYRIRHPRLWSAFKPVLETIHGGTISDTNTQLPMVELRLTPEGPWARTPS